MDNKNENFFLSLAKGAGNYFTGGLAAGLIDSLFGRDSESRYDENLSYMEWQHHYNQQLLQQQQQYNKENLATQNQYNNDAMYLANRFQSEQNEQQYQRQRELTRDTPMLTQQGLASAGMNANTANFGSAQNVSGSSAPSASGVGLPSVGAGSSGMASVGPAYTGLADLLHSANESKLIDAQVNKTNEETNKLKQENATFMTKFNSDLQEQLSRISFNTKSGENLDWDSEVKRGMSNLQYVQYDKLLAEIDKIEADTKLSEQEKKESIARTTYYYAQAILGRAEANRINKLLPKELDLMDKKVTLSDDEHSQFALQLGILAKDLDWYEFNKICEGIGVATDVAKSIYEGVNTVRGRKSSVTSVSTSNSTVEHAPFEQTEHFTYKNGKLRAKTTRKK